MKFGVRLRATPHVLTADTSMTDGSSNFKLMSCGCVNVQRDIVDHISLLGKTSKLSMNDSGNKNGSEHFPPVQKVKSHKSFLQTFKATISVSPSEEGSTIRLDLFF